MSRVFVLLTVVIALAAVSARAQNSRKMDRPMTVQRVESGAAVEPLPVNVNQTARVGTVRDVTLSRVASGEAAGRTAGVVATTVYLNDVAPDASELLIYVPGINPDDTTTELMAEDVELAASGQVTGYAVGVGGFASAGAPTQFTVRTALWDGDPCVAGSAVIPGTEASTVVPNDGLGQLVEVTLPAPVSVPDVVWLAMGFDTDDAGAILAERAEIGYTRDLWSENDLDGVGECTQLFFGGDPFAGFLASIDAELATPPTGACCDGRTCTIVAEADCTVGVWQGPFTTCDPSPCVAGSCCTGTSFEICLDTIPTSTGTEPMSEADCAGLDGLFHPSTTCVENPCGPVFPVYQNTGPVVGLVPDADDETTGDIKIADDQIMGPGAPCELSHFSIDLAGVAFSGSFDATVELWTVDAQSGLPFEPIPGTQTVFTGVRDGAQVTLRTDQFTGIQVPEAVWMVLDTSTDASGWLFGSEATIGVTNDFFAIFNAAGSADQWAGFDFLDETLFSGFLGEVWCKGTEPTGACCNDALGTCTDNVTERDCPGRWAQGSECALEPFTPPCGATACCSEGGGCQDIDPSTCAGIGGLSAPAGTFCDDLTACPRSVCFNGTGDCLDDNRPLAGCGDAFCCETVCQIDPFCCDVEWDLNCAQTAQSACSGPPANDNCADATPIEGEGLFAFDNTAATTDGPSHLICENAGGDGQIGKDVWYTWTAPCTGTVYVRTCGLTDVDSKLAVYDGTTCPPSGIDLLNCNDDLCGFNPDGSGGLQSQLSFEATGGQPYLIRVGVFPGNSEFPAGEGGTGQFEITCGVPDQPPCGVVGAGDCCNEGGTASAACDDESCCEAVCACDPFCCEVEWDGACATTGFEGSGCGADFLCGTFCATCPLGTVTFRNPPNGVVDARQPFPPDNGLLQGIDRLTVAAPAGADNPDCWSVCDSSGANDNGVSAIVDNGDGTFTLELVRPITANAVTTVTYTDDTAVASSAVLTSHPANVNGDAQANVDDVSALIDALTGVTPGPWGIYSEDVDRSGASAPPDLLRVIDLLNGGGPYDPQMSTALPTCGACCP